MTFVPSVYACLKKSAFSYAYKLLTWSRKPVSFYSTIPITSTTRLWHAIGAALKIERVWLVSLTCLSKKLQVAKIPTLKTVNVWNGLEDAKQIKHSRKCHHNSSSLPSVAVQTLERLPPWLWAHSLGTSPSDWCRFVSTTTTKTKTTSFL